MPYREAFASAYRVAGIATGGQKLASGPSAGGGQTTISPPSNVNLAGREVVLTGPEVADLLKVSRATFFRLVKAGRIPGRIDEPGLPVRYLRSAVVGWLESAAVGLGRPQAESGRTAQPAGCGA
jgi:excisionase family DNA binding protein